MYDLIVNLFIIITAIICCISQWVLFKKANKPGWATIVPVYNLIVYFEIGKIKPIMVLLLFVPIVNFVLIIEATVKFAKAFGKRDLYALGLIFLPFIFYPMLAFGKSEYQA